MTLEQAKALKAGMIVYSTVKKNVRAKVTSVKLWKTRPDNIEVHVKRGLYEYAVFNQDELELITVNQ